MNSENKRRFSRVVIETPVSYAMLDDTGNVYRNGIGRTINISREGLQVETPEPLESRQVSLIALDRDNRLMKFKGEVVYSRPGTRGRFENGIRFAVPPAAQQQIVVNFIKAYHHQKHLRHAFPCPMPALQQPA